MASYSPRSSSKQLKLFASCSIFRAEFGDNGAAVLLVLLADADDDAPRHSRRDAAALRLRGADATADWSQPRRSHPSIGWSVACSGSAPQ
jgi:hypothetical protein